MGLFDRDKPKKEEKPKADFSNVQSGSSSTAPAPTVAPAVTESRTYTVERGDTLWAIAERFYGSGGKWKKIHEANRGLIENPDVIQPGWVLSIPPEEGSER